MHERVTGILLGAVLAGLVASYGGLFYYVRELRIARDTQNASALQAARVITLYEATVAKQEREASSTLLFVGDVMLSRGVGARIVRHDDPSFPFSLIASSTHEADVLIGNLEGPISAHGEDWGNPISFRANPRVVDGLISAGFKVLGLANNHIMDWGRAALSDTVALLQSAGVSTIGAGRNEAEANEPLIINAKGGRVALLNYTGLLPKSFEANSSTAGISHFDPAGIADAIRNAKMDADIVVVLIHWGEEYRAHATSAQQDVGRALIDAGASLVVGTHPHVTEEVEQYHGGWIAYSLGNFVFDQNFSEATNKGEMLEVRIAHKAIEAVRTRPIHINGDFQPEEVRL